MNGAFGCLENPTPPGDSKNNRLAYLFQAKLFLTNSVFPLSTTNGPISYRSPNKLEQPGPPFNHNMTGSVFSVFVFYVVRKT